MPGLILENDILQYIERPLKETGIVRKTNCFKVAVSDIRIIGFIAIVLLDDEDFIISIVDKNLEEHKFSSLEFQTNAAEFLNKEFTIDLNNLWGSFSYLPFAGQKIKSYILESYLGKTLSEYFFKS